MKLLHYIQYKLKRKLRLGIILRVEILKSKTKRNQHSHSSSAGGDFHSGKSKRLELTSFITRRVCQRRKV